MVAVDCDCCWNLYFSWFRAAEEASAFRAMAACSWSFRAAALVAAAAVAAAVVVAAAACDAAAFPRVVDEVSARVDVRKIDFRASPLLQTKLGGYPPPVTGVAFRKEASPSADFLDDMKGGYSSAVDDAAASDAAVPEAPMRGDARAGAGQPPGFRSAGRQDRQKEPSSYLSDGL